jgi:hypothetical protein
MISVIQEASFPNHEIKRGKRMKASASEKPGMNAPAIYRITVDGQLNSDWSDRIEGMNITHVSDDEKTTVLVGRLRDQAALSGVLNTLYELHLPVLSVNCLENG